MRTRNKSKGRGHQTTVAEQAESWPTPQASDVRSGSVSEKTFHSNPRLREHASRFFLPARTPLRRGAKSSKLIPRLNPRFVEHLMNFPLGWTINTPLAWTDYERWEMASSLWLRDLLSLYYAENTRASRAAA